MREEERQVEWRETLDGILGKLKELKEENETLKEEVELWKNRCEKLGE
jgi:FtsZ-binding cell division protein ZapB